MALAEWGRWDDEMDPFTLASLAQAYARRKKYEAQLLALEVGKLLGGTAGRGATRPAAPSYRGRYRVVSANALLSRMGATLH